MQNYKQMQFGICKRINPKIGAGVIAKASTIDINNNVSHVYFKSTHSIEHVGKRFMSEYRPVVMSMMPAPAVSYDEFVKGLERNRISSVEITKDSADVELLYSDGSTHSMHVPDAKRIDFMNKVKNKDIDITYNQPFWTQWVQYISYGIFLFVFGSVVLQIVSSQRKTMADFTNTLALQDIETNVTFDDVAGIKNAKQDLQEIVEFLKNPDKFTKLGARIPKGALLIGPSGTGKTLLAKAVAGEAGVPFFSCSASEMVQMFVGVGSARVRSLFEKASKKAPSIIFIDEIDAVGKARGGFSVGGANDEREQTINQLLTEMDGFKENTGVVVIAATNRVDVLDPALLRPGRFDRQINVDLPDFKDRVSIMNIHTKNKPIVEEDKENIINRVAKLTTGFSGADLANLANEAAILAARGDQDNITWDNFQHAMDKIMLGDKRDIMVSEEKKKITAYHEAGHALVALKLELYDSIRTVSIMPRGKTGGVTIFEPNDDDLDMSLLKKNALENQIAVALGGRIAEEITFGEEYVTTGASGDINMVQNIARHMVTHYGLSKKMGAIAWHANNSISPNEFSESTRALIDQEIKLIVERIYEKTRKLLLENRNALNAIAEKLIVHEVLSDDEVKSILVSC